MFRGLLVLLFCSNSFAGTLPSLDYRALIRNCNPQYTEVVNLARKVNAAKIQLKIVALKRVVLGQVDGPLTQTDEFKNLSEAYRSVLLSSMKFESGDFLQAFLCADFYGANFPRFESELMSQAVEKVRYSSEGPFWKKVGNLGTYLFDKLDEREVNLDSEHLDYVVKMTTLEDWKILSTEVKNMGDQEILELASLIQLYGN